jgi:hypothetical protein
MSMYLRGGFRRVDERSRKCRLDELRGICNVLYRWYTVAWYISSRYWASIMVNVYVRGVSRGIHGTLLKVEPGHPQRTLRWSNSTVGK